MVGIFENLDITAETEFDNRVKYTEHILEGPTLKKYCAILLVCKETTKRYDIYQWMIGEAKDASV